MKAYTFISAASAGRPVQSGRHFLGKAVGTCSLTSAPHRQVRWPSSEQNRRRDAGKPFVTMSLLPVVPDWILISTWLFGAYRFYRGFNRTPYQSSFRVPLAVAWPLLIIVNGSYRQNFMRSIRAADDDY